MIVKPITFPNHQPLNRTLAAQVVQTASRFDARVMIRRHQKVVNTVLHFCDTFFTSLQRGIITHINYGEFLVLLSFPDLTSEAAILQTAAQDISLLKNNLRRYLSIHTFAESMPVFDSVEHLRPYYLKIHHRLQVKPFNSDSEKRKAIPFCCSPYRRKMSCRNLFFT